MNWKKLGKVFCANKQTQEMFLGARTPVPLVRSNGQVDIYFASLDQQNLARIFCLSININQPNSPFNLNTKPVFDLGKLGFFDDNGTLPSCIIEVDSKLMFYTIGFSVKNKIIFDAAVGLALSDDDGQTFTKFNGPILDRSIYDPGFSTSPCVIFDQEEKKFKMWYVSCERWEKQSNGSHKHFYNIKYRESKDGIHWSHEPTTSINFENEYEYAISRPSVIKDGPRDYKMWYSFRAQKNINTYRIGYATSEDGQKWFRQDHLMYHFDVSEKGWDSKMICYPCVFDCSGKRYMLYAGNHYGDGGFGLATQD